VPFNMKVGEAGEAFFVFETDSDVPDDLITSPLLEPTQPVSPDPPPAEDFGRFGTRNRSGDLIDDGLSQEPDFLDLDAPSTSLSGEVFKPSASFNLASPSHKPIPFPSLHPSSALSPDHLHHTSVSLPGSSATSDEYSWEWGGFPQRSRIHMEDTHSDTAPLIAARGTETDDQLVVSQSGEFQRSKSLPPELEHDLTTEVPSISLQSDEQLNEQELLSDVETGFDHDPMLGRERGSWARWWRRDNRYTQRVDGPSDRPPLQSVASAPLPTVSFVCPSILAILITSTQKRKHGKLLPLMCQLQTSARVMLPSILYPHLPKSYVLVSLPRFPEDNQRCGTRRHSG
jgi:hypothetical protein